MTDDTEAPPQGVVMIFIDEHGQPICEATDFDRSGYGGFKLKEAQRMRCKAELARQVVRTYASSQLSRAVEQHQCEQIMRDLQSRFKCKVKVVFVGHDRERHDDEI